MSKSREKGFDVIVYSDGQKLTEKLLTNNLTIFSWTSSLTKNN